MRHLKAGRQLGRDASHRKAMFRNMAVSLVNQENITTTDAKAKELRRFAEKLITLGKKGSLHARRRARTMVNDKDALNKLFTVLAERYKERPGGYTRIIKQGYRPGDSAPLSVIQLVQDEMPNAKGGAKKAKAPAKESALVEEAVIKEEAKAKAEEQKDEALEPTEEVKETEAAGTETEEVEEEAADAGETSRSEEEVKVPAEEGEQVKTKEETPVEPKAEAKEEASEETEKEPEEEK